MTLTVGRPEVPRGKAAWLVLGRGGHGIGRRDLHHPRREGQLTLFYGGGVRLR